jgi:hypothetical protein
MKSKWVFMGWKFARHSIFRKGDRIPPGWIQFSIER